MYKRLIARSSCYPTPFSLPRFSCLNSAFDEALGERRGIVRFGHAYVPLDEALSR